MKWWGAGDDEARRSVSLWLLLFIRQGTGLHAKQVGARRRSDRAAGNMQKDEKEKLQHPGFARPPGPHY